jgi:ATP-dependent DNA ligase
MHIRLSDIEPASQFVIDGEAVILGVEGIADFNALHSRQHDENVQLYAFDILALDGEDLRDLPARAAKVQDVPADQVQKRDLA